MLADSLCLICREHVLDFFINVQNASIGVDPLEASQLIKVFNDGHGVLLMSNKLSFQDLEAVALPAAAQTSIDASPLVAVQEKNKLCLKW